MRQVFSFVSAMILLSCNNQVSNANGTVKGSDSTIVQAANDPAPGKEGCGNSLLFTKGAVIDAATYDGKGEVVGLQTSEVKNVFGENGMTISETDILTRNAEGRDEKTFKTTYKCNGAEFIMDMSGFFGNGREGSTISTSGLSFPLELKGGETLPDANHTISIATGGKNMKIISVIKDRKVSAKESITIPAGTFEAYKITALIDATTEMEGMTEEMKKSMEEMKKKMGDNRFIVWYTPGLTILKMEMYTGGKLQSRTEVTKIKK